MDVLPEVKGKRIFVGLSGGVDSAVSAALLKHAGAIVTGVFIKGWYPPGMPCTWADDRRDAMRVAARLGIPFLTLDASAEYKKGVIDYLLSEYAAGRTPNPDIMCNREVKFGAFYAFARNNNADLIATGHYAQNPLVSGIPELQRGQDATKDQSYFLWAVPKEALARTLFPVGSLPKSEVRALATKFDLPVATKKDSQGICFLGSISVADFLRQELSPERGEVLDATGNVLGTHDGAILYTLGEKIAVQDAPPGPWYVRSKDLTTNQIVVSHTSEAKDASSTLLLRESNWLKSVSDSSLVFAQYRYHGPLVEGTVSQEENIFTPTLVLPESIAAGQSLVLYEQDTCIGGGIIT